MNFESATWTIRELFKLKDRILLQPKYQRAAVWSPSKKRLLIDSILRGYDIPKFYLVQTKNNPLHSYEVEDGQQRLRAIFEFIEGVEGSELDSSTIGEFNLTGATYDSLSIANKPLVNAFLDFKINISLIIESTPEELRTLFARLQLGEKLTSAELRNAIASNLGAAIKSIVETNSFFLPDCRIKDTRFAHQEYLDMAICASHYECEQDIKAPNLKEMYQEFAFHTLKQMQPLLQKTNQILQYMHDINSFKKGIFKNKWAFVDVFTFFFTNFKTIKGVKPKAFSENFAAFDKKRLEYNSDPVALVKNVRSKIYDPYLYQYILAFQRGGAEKKNLQYRQEAIQNKFFNRTNLKL